MWPWEHLAFGYLLYSATTHAANGEPPDGRAALALALATQVPDLVDKPLAWSFGVFPVGYAVAHSALVVVPTLVAVGVLLERRGVDRDLLSAYAVGHLSHLVGDLVYPVLEGRPLPLARVLWPLSSYRGPSEETGVLAHVLRYGNEYVHRLLALHPSPLLLVEVGLMIGVVVLWVSDGLPGLRAAYELVSPR